MATNQMLEDFQPLSAVPPFISHANPPTEADDPIYVSSASPAPLGIGYFEISEADR
jgi:hypothetical protein